MPDTPQTAVAIDPRPQHPILRVLTFPKRKLSFLSDPRARVLSVAAMFLVGCFWFLMRYPALMHKSTIVGEKVASMAFASQVWVVGSDASAFMQVLAGAVNWLDTMKIGMTFGVLFGALLHTTLRYFPLKVGQNVRLNSVKGALIGAPMGICANCAVPTSCGVTRGDGKLEVALGFLFSSPNFNPVVIMMTITALPAGMVLAKYAILVAMIVIGVPLLVKYLAPKPLVTQESIVAEEGALDAPMEFEIPKETVRMVTPDLAKQFVRHVWMLLKPTLMIMLVASFAASAALVFLPIDELLANPGFWSFGIISVIATLMPVPIALDVLFAGQLQANGFAPGYVMLFAMTLGTFSIVPAIYMWREISRKLSATLLIFFMLLGWFLAWAFQFMA